MFFSSLHDISIYTALLGQLLCMDKVVHAKKNGQLPYFLISLCKTGSDYANKVSAVFEETGGSSKFQLKKLNTKAHTVSLL